MKMQLDTIPLWDSFREGGECPLCTLSRYLEEQFLDGTLGGAAMDPDIRIMSNEKGYCAKHFKALFDLSQRLPLGLITHTNLLETTEKIRALAEPILNPAAEKKHGLFARKDNDPLDALLAQTDTSISGCMICERVETTMARYEETAAYLYKKDSAFAELYRSGQGFCLPHFSALLKAAKGELSGKTLDEFTQDTLRMELAALDRVGDELKQFTLMFDYRNVGKEWGTSRDALPRAIAKLRGGPRPDDAGTPQKK